MAVPRFYRNRHPMRDTSRYIYHSTDSKSYVKLPMSHAGVAKRTYKIDDGRSYFGNETQPNAYSSYVNGKRTAIDRVHRGFFGLDD